VVVVVVVGGFFWGMSTRPEVGRVVGRTVVFLVGC